MRAVLKAMMRSPQVVFWVVVFPTLLFVILASIFGGMAEGEGFKPQVGFVVFYPLDRLALWALPVVYRFGVEGYMYPDTSSAMDALKKGKVDAVVAPKFGDAGPELTVYYTDSRMDSRLTADIIKSLSAQRDAVDVEVVEVKPRSTPVSWFYYGILMMIPVEVGFMFIPSALIELMRGGLLKRFYLAGVSPQRAVFGLSRLRSWFLCLP